jgi:hypothetical protein
VRGTAAAGREISLLRSETAAERERERRRRRERRLREREKQGERRSTF